MTLRLAITRNAVQDLREIWAYIAAEENSDVADRVREDITQ